jgi:hypothetical protein
MVDAQRGSPSRIESGMGIKHTTRAGVRVRIHRSRFWSAVVILLVLLSVTLPSIFLPRTGAGVFTKSPKQSVARSDDHLTQSYGKLPLSFEPNQGQIQSSAKFVAHGADSDVYLTSNEIVLSLTKPKPSATAESSSASISKEGKGPRVLNHSHVDSESPRDEVRMKLAGGHAARIGGVDELPGTVNYFIGSNPKSWHTNIRTYRKVRYEEVYPGIDQVFYGSSQQLEYDFIISPGANPRTIKLEFAGQSDLTVDASGDLVLHAKGAQEIRLHKPFAYQEIGGGKQEVSARYAVGKKHQVRIEIGDYDASKRLIVDPVLSYSTYLGGSGNDAGFDIAVDSSGSAYVTGSTDSSEFSPLGGANAFIAKLSPDGTQRTYLAILGGSGDDTGFSIALDNAGAAYITGATNSIDFPVATSFQSSFGGGSQDAFVAKLSPDGSSVVYASYFGGSGSDSGFGIAVDSTGSAYITGSTDSPELSTLGNTDAFVTKLSPAGNTRVYSCILGGSGDDTGFDIAVDGQGSAYVVGSTDSKDFTTVNALQPNFGGAQDAFVAKLNPDGAALAYSTYFGGSGNDSGFGIAVDSAGSAYVTGSTDSPEFTSLGGRDAFVAKLSAAGNERTYFTILGGSGDDAGFCIAVDSSGNAFITGSSDSSNFTIANPVQANLGGSQDAFIARLNSSGATLDYSTLMGSSGNQAGFGIAIDNTGASYVTGFTSSSSFPTLSPLQAASGGSGDAFVQKISGAATPSTTVQFASSSYTVGEGDGQVNITISRSGDTTGGSSVGYATSDSAGLQNCNVINGLASSRCDYISALGTINFAAGETSKTIPILIVDDSYAEGNETFAINLSNASGATLGTQTFATITIVDNDTATGPNPNDVAGSFVRQHYLDFLNRQPDPSGLAFWTNQITSCGSNQSCIDAKRINVSAAYFLSIEFQQTGYLVERIYKAAYGDGTGTSTLGGPHQLPVPVIRLNEFLPDTQEIGNGVIVNQTGWEQVLENNKQAFTSEFVQRSRFTAAFPTSVTTAQFVDTLNTNAGGPLSSSERNQLVSDLSSGAKTRAQVLRAVAEDPVLNSAEFNRAFVLMQYFGYLRRNPNDPQDTDYTGYDFWLAKLNRFTNPGDDVLVRVQNAEMVKAFIVSIEYRQRFGP